MFCSSKRTVRPSAERPLGKDQLSHVRLRSTLSAAEKPTISRREEFTAKRTRPSRATSRRNPAGTLQTVRVLPQSVVDECDQTTIGRDADVAHPPGRGVQHLSDRVVEPAAVSDVTCHRKTLP